MISLRYTLILALSFISLHQAKAQTELQLLEQLQLRISINHDDGSKEQFMLSEKKSKAQAMRSYHWYHAQRIHISQGGYSGKLLHGSYSLYYPSKALAKQGFFKKGLQEGTWKEWSRTAKLMKIEHWQKGRREGSAQHFDAEGRLSLQGKMKHNLWHGKVKTFSSADSSYHWTYYAKGQLISKESYIQSSILRRFGHSIQQLWHKAFTKDAEADILAP